MKIRLLLLLPAACLLALALWYVDHSGRSDVADRIAVAPSAIVDDSGTNRLAVAKALAYLAKHQHKDGHWEDDDGNYPVAMTGFVGLALLMSKDYPDDAAPSGPTAYTDSVEKAADWLMGQCQPGRGGLIFSGHESETARYMDGHGLATIFLAGVRQKEADDARRKKLDAILAGAVGYIAKAQSSRGGWYHTSKMEGHDLAAIQPTAIQVQALAAACYTSIPMRPEMTNDGQEYLRSEIQKIATPAPDPERMADIAAALACRFTSPWDGDEVCEAWLERCRAEIPTASGVNLGRDDLAHYYYAQAACYCSQQRDVTGRGPSEPWDAYRAGMFDRLRNMQNADGSWPAGDGSAGGVTRSTALWCVVLQMGRNRHPSQRVPDQFK